MQPCFAKQRKDGKNHPQGQLFQKIELVEDGGLNFSIFP